MDLGTLLRKRLLGPSGRTFRPAVPLAACASGVEAGLQGIGGKALARPEPQAAGPQRTSRWSTLDDEDSETDGEGNDVLSVKKARTSADLDSEASPLKPRNLSRALTSIPNAPPQLTIGSLDSLRSMKFEGVSHWSSPLTGAIRASRAAFILCNMPRRGLRHASGCAGTAIELLGPRCLGLWMLTLHASECDRTPQRFMQSNWGTAVPHIVTDMAAQVAGAGHCVVCDKFHALEPMSSMDVWVTGTPCDPFTTERREQKGGTGNTGPSSEHASFRTSVFTFLEAFKNPETRPKGGIYENVPGLCQRSRDPALPPGCYSWMDFLLQELRGMEYAADYTMVDNNMFVKVPRKRPYVVYLGAELGGTDALRWIMKAVDEMISCLEKLHPPRWLDVVRDSPGEMLVHQQTTCYKYNSDEIRPPYIARTFATV